MAPRAQFVHTGCSLPLFCDAYTRNNKSTGHKNLRCFPHCCGSHRPNSFCGMSIVVQVDGLDISIAGAKYIAFCRFEVADESEAIRCPMPLSMIADDIKSTDVPLGTWMFGERNDSNQFESYRYEFNRNRQSWHYGWRSNRFNCNLRHALVVYVFEQQTSLHGDILHVRCRVASPSFTVGSTRRSATKTPSSPADNTTVSDEDDELKHLNDIHSDESPRFKRPRVRSKTGMGMETPNYHEDIEKAINDMVRLAELYSRCVVGSALTTPEPYYLDMQELVTTSTYSILVDILEYHVFTLSTIHHVQSCLEKPSAHENTHELFREIIWYIWKQVNHALESRQTSISELLDQVQRDFPWCQFTQGYSTWYTHFINLTEAFQQTTRSPPTTNNDLPASLTTNPLVGRWQRDTDVRHSQLVQQHLLDRGSRIWTCMLAPDDGSIQMRWECSVYSQWTIFKLDQSPQSNTQQLLGPCGLPTLGSGMELCGTRAWEENQGDTLVVEWYFWPQEGSPRKRVRERFTLLASTTNSLMCQKVVELCWDVQNISTTLSASQRMLQPANWQVHHIDNCYYHRIG